MKIVLWVLAAVAAIVLLGGVVLPVVAWLLHSLAWVVAGALVIGGGIWVAKKITADKGDSTDTLVTDQNGRRLP